MNPTNQPEMPDVPAILKREPKPVVSAAAVTNPQPAQPQKAFRTGRVLPDLTQKPEAPAKAKPKAKATREPKAKAAKPQHKATEMQRTDANPAKSIVPPSFKARYAEHDDSNGDRVAEALKSFVAGINKEGRPATDLDKLRQVARDNGIDYRRYEGLNVGQQRMNVGNRLRGILKAGKAVVIGKQRFADAAKALKVA